MKYIKLTLAFLAVVAFGIAVHVVLFGRDIEPIDDSALLLAPTPILAEDDNAHFLLPTVVSKSNLSERQLTDQFIVASKREGYQCPTTVNNYSFANTEFCSLNDLRDLAFLTAARATSSLARGDTIDAIESATAIVRMAHMLADSNGPLIEKLVAIAMYRVALEPLREIAPTLTTAQAEQLRTTLQASAPGRAMLVHANKVEYMQLKDTIQWISNGEYTNIPAGYELRPTWYRFYVLHPNRTTAELANFYTLVIEAQRLPCGETNEQLSQEISKIVNEKSRISPMDYVRPNMIGTILIAMYIGSLNDVSTTACALESEYSKVVEEL